MNPDYLGVEDLVGHTPLVRLQRILSTEARQRGNVVLAKVEGDNPAGSVKDRPALAMIQGAEERGEIRPGDTLIEATSGNTGIALAMAAAAKGYGLILLMPEDASIERAQTMAAYGAEIMLTPKAGSMEQARDMAAQMQRDGLGKVLDQFANPDNPKTHEQTTGPEVWEQTRGQVTHFVSSMGTTGTVVGTSRYLKRMNPKVTIVGVQPAEGARIPGIRRWKNEYVPRIFDPSAVDLLWDVNQAESETMARRMAAEEGLFVGVSSGGACSAALRLAEEVRQATIVFIACDRGDRYLSSQVFPRVSK